ncbi:PGF-pre-PGF domain-containing protein [archaeon]|nr:PGF-pre-PGF domain-containing protein [archaeon]
MLSGESKTLFGGAGMYVEAVEFMLNTQRESVGLSVKEYQYTTPSVTYSISIPYKYYEITASNFVNADVQSAEITFKVENSWLTSQGLTINDIAMYRYTTGWSELDTSMTSQDNTFTYYKAITPGFSTFVIAKKGGEFVLPPTKPEPTTPPTTTPPTTTPPTTPSIGADKGTDDGTTLIDEEALDKKKGTLLWSVIAIIIILAVLGVWVFGKGGSAELHMKKAEEHHRNALRHKREALGHESRGDNNAARESLRKAADQENKVTGHRRKASHLLLSKK